MASRRVEREVRWSKGLLTGEDVLLLIQFALDNHFVITGVWADDSEDFMLMERVLETV